MVDRNDSRARGERPTTGSLNAERVSTQAAPLVAYGNDLVVLDFEPGAFLFGHWKNVTILVWAARADASTIARLGRALAGIASPPGGRSAVSVLVEGLPLPSAETRAAIVDVINNRAQHLACLGVVVNGSGFASSALMSAHTDIRAKSTGSYEMGLLGSIEELATWLPPLHLQRTLVKIEPAELADRVRRALDMVRRSARDVAPSRATKRTR
jgi:hypothetical protein